MKCSISKEDYLKIYEMTDDVFTLDFDCGSLCNNICCTIEQEAKDGEYLEMVLYLLPGEEELFFENEWFELYYETTDEYEYPDSWNGKVYFVKCSNPPHCMRNERPIQCRSFPVSPHLDGENNLHLIYDEDDFNYNCPIISEKMKLSDDFIENILKMWARLIEDDLIFDLIKMESEERENNNKDYEMIV